MSKTAFLFPGQGSQHQGMGKLLAEHYEVAKLTFEEADHVLGFDLSHLCFSGPEANSKKPRTRSPRCSRFLSLHCAC